jgi:hypothetical protein
VRRWPCVRVLTIDDGVRDMKGQRNTSAAGAKSPELVIPAVHNGEQRIGGAPVASSSLCSA